MAAAETSAPADLWNDDLYRQPYDYGYNEWSKDPASVNQSSLATNPNGALYSRPSIPSSSSTILTSSSGSTNSLGLQPFQQQPRRRLYSQHRSQQPGTTSSLAYSNSSLGGRWTRPSTPQEVRSLCNQVRDRLQQLELCQDMMLWIRQIKNEMSSSTLDLDRSLLHNVMETRTRNLLQKLSKSSCIGEAGVGEAQFLLGSCYGTGALGLAKDPAKACAWYIQSSKQYHREATYRVAMCYEMGIGIRQDYDRAIAYYQKGAKLSHAPCMYKLGVVQLKGYCRQTQQPRQAICWIQRAADSFVVNSSSNSLLSSSSTMVSTTTEAHFLPYAMHALAMVQLTGECTPTSLIPDPHYALQILRRAAKLGYEASQYKLAEFYETGEWMEPDDAKSIYWYTNAAKQGSPEAALGLSGWYLTGSNTPGVLVKSERESYLWAKRAATTAVETRDYYSGEKPIQLAVANACYVVAHYLENGIGVERDTSLEETIKWYSKAAQFGHQLAISRMKEFLAEKAETNNHTSKRKKPSLYCSIM